jgi:HSP20 family protein
MNRMFDNFRLERFGAFQQWSGSFVPAVDVSEDDKDICVLSERPGIDEKDIDVTVGDGMLTIRGRKKAAPGGKGQSLCPWRNLRRKLLQSC